MSMVDDAATYLCTLGITGVTSVGANVFKNWRPEEPDSVTVLTETGGARPVGSMGAAAPVERPGLQVICRGAANTDPEARDRIYNVWRALVLVVDMDMGGNHYRCIEALDQPAYMSHDHNERPLYVANFVVTV